MTRADWYPGAERLPITTKEYTVPRGVDLIGVVDHITDGWDSRNYLQNVANDSSVHFLIREEGGGAKVYQFMPVSWAAWGNGRHSANSLTGEGNPFMPEWVRDLVRRRVNINRATVSIEHERKWPFTTPLSGPMLQASKDLHKWLVKEWGIQADRVHIIGHYQIDHIERAHCPGGPGGVLFPFGDIISYVNAPPPPPPPPLPTSVTFPETGKTVAADFYRYWVDHGGLPDFGYPVLEEEDMALPDGSTIRVQSFQRARFERHPDGIKLGLVEVERLKAAGRL